MEKEFVPWTMQEPLGERSSLKFRDLPTTDHGKIEQVIEECALKWFALCRPLDFDELARTSADHIHIGLCSDVLFITEIEHRCSIENANAHCRD